MSSQDTPHDEQARPAVGGPVQRMVRPGAEANCLCQPNGLMFDAFGEPRTRYVRVTLNRSHCVMHPSEGDCYVQDARDAGDPDWERYIVRDVYLSDREFEDLPEHDGF